LAPVIAEQVRASTRVKKAGCLAVAGQVGKEETLRRRNLIDDPQRGVSSDTGPVIVPAGATESCFKFEK